MVKRLLYISLVLLGCASSNDLMAQDPIFSQFYANPLYLNPAFAGTARCPRFVMNYRNQWPGISGQYITYSASYDQHVDAIAGGLGILVTNDKAGQGGILTTTNFSAIYSYQLPITREFSMKFGFQGTYYQKSVDWNKLNFGDMIDARRGFIWNTQETPNQIKRTNPDISAGILGFSKRYFFGFSAKHITEPDEGFIGQSKLPIRYTAHAGAVIPFQKGGDSFISPNILYQRQQDFNELNLGLYITKGPIVGGLWYRNSDSFIALIGFQQNLFKCGYSYDVTVSKLTNQTAGSHELSFQLQFECKPKKKKFRTISCPSF